MDQFPPFPIQASGEHSERDPNIPQKPKRKKTSTVRVQYGALPYRFTPYGALEILIVTSRQTRRWIIPKGWPIRKLKPGKSAAREAFEEAGIRGRISTKAVGAFTYEKALNEKDLEVSCEVRVFSLLVKTASERVARSRAAHNPVGRSCKGYDAGKRAGTQGPHLRLREAHRRYDGEAEPLSDNETAAN